MIETLLCAFLIIASGLGILVQGWWIDYSANKKKRAIKDDDHQSDE